MTDHDRADDGERDDNGDRLAVDLDTRSGGGTLADILAATTANVARSRVNLEGRAAELAAHRAGCLAEECRTCERVKCYGCGATKQGLGGLCAACVERERYDRAKVRVFASIPKRFRWAIDGNLSALAGRVKLPPARISAALAWAAGLGATPPSLVLTGETATGKTSLIVAMFAAWFARHRNEQTRFVAALELGLARSRQPLGHGDPPAVVAAIEAPLLILDDLGMESPMHADVLRQVLLARHNEDLPTWVTTGLLHPAVAQRYDGGLARRLFESAKHVALGSAA